MKRWIVASLLLPQCVACVALQAAQITWTNSDGGLWSDTRNWSPNQVPGSADIAVIDQSGTYTIQLDINARVGGFNLGGGHGSHGIITDRFALIADGPSLVDSNGFLSVFPSGALGGAGAIIVNGAINFFGGGGAGTGLLSIRAGGELSVDGGVSFGLRSIENAGKIQWFSGVISVGALTNLSTGEIDILLSGSTLFVNTLLNSGMIRRQSGTGVVSMPFNVCRNEGTIDVQTGTLNASGRLVNAGSVSVNGAATCNLNTPSGDVSDFLAGSTLIGEGAIVIGDAGTKNFAGQFDVAEITFAAGAINVGSGALLTNGAVRIEGGTVNFNTGTTLSPSSLTMTSGTLSGNDSWMMTGPVFLNGGDLRGAGMIDCLGGLTVTAARLWDGLLKNSATATINGTFGVGSNAVFRTAADGTTELVGVITDISASGQKYFQNEGLLRINSAGTAYISVPLKNDGTVDVRSGGLYLAPGGSHTGSFVVEQGTHLGFALPGLILSAGVRILGTGDVTFGDTFLSPPINVPASLSVTGTVAVAGNVKFTGQISLDHSHFVITNGTADFSTGRPLVAQELLLLGGALAGNDPLTVNGPITWSGSTTATLAGPAELIAKGGITLNGYRLFLNGRRLYNLSAAVWSGGTLFTGNGSIISNAVGASFEISFDARSYAGFAGSRSFINAGLLRRSGSTGTAAITDSIYNRGTIEVRSGTLSVADFVQIEGATILQGGDIAVQEFLNIQGGLLAGAGQISGAVLLGGQCAPGNSAGSLRINGDYTQTGSGRLNIELGGTSPGTTYDQLNISGAANLAGALNVSSLGGYQPPPGASFRVLTFASPSGDFSAFNDTTSGNLQRQYDATGLTLVATETQPRLTILREGDHLRLAWPPSAAGYQLQCASNVPSTTWLTLGTETNWTTIAPTQRQYFYRLIKP